MHDRHYQHAHGPDGPSDKPHSHGITVSRYFIGILIILACITGTGMSSLIERGA